MGLFSEIDSAFGLVEKLRKKLNAADLEEIISKIINVKLLALELQSENFSLKKELEEFKHLHRIDREYEHLQFGDGFVLVRKDSADGSGKIPDSGKKRLEFFCQFCGAEGKLIGLTKREGLYVCLQCSRVICF